MFLFLLSLLIIYPEEDETVEDFFVVLSDFKDTTLPEFLLDGREITGEFQRGDYALVFIPAISPYSGIHKLTVISGEDTIPVHFRIKGKKKSLTVNTGVMLRYSSLLPNQITGYLEFPYYGKNLEFNLFFRTVYGESILQVTYPIYLMLKGWNTKIKAGNFYPLDNNIFVKGRKIRGLEWNFLNKLWLFWGKDPLNEKREILGVRIGGVPFSLNLIRAQSLDTLENYDNWVVGFSSSFQFSKYNIECYGGSSIYTRDITRMDGNGVPEIPDWLFHLNATTIPLIPTTYSSFVGMEIRSPARFMYFRWYGPSFYNKAIPGLVQGLWKLLYTERFRVSNINILGNVSVTGRESGIDYNTRLGVTLKEGSIHYTYSSAYSIHSINLSLDLPVKVFSYSMLSSSYKRLETEFILPFPLKPGMKLDFSNGFPPVYSISVNIERDKIRLLPQLIFSTGNTGFRIRVNSHVFQTPIYISIYKLAEYFGFNLQVSHRFSLPL